MVFQSRIALFSVYWAYLRFKKFKEVYIMARPEWVTYSDEEIEEMIS